MKFFFSFGQSHVHRVNGKTFDCDSIVEIHADNEGEARLKMVDTFGKKWAGCYTEERFKPEHFPRGVIEVIK